MLPSVAYAAQETKWDAVSYAPVWCDNERFGSIRAVVDATAVKASADGRDWDDQHKIDFWPFRHAGKISLTGSDECAGISRLCITVKIAALAKNNLATTNAYFSRSMVWAFDTERPPRVVGRFAYFTGSKCQDYNGAYSAAVVVQPTTDDGGPYVYFGSSNEVDKVTMKTRTTVYWGASFFSTQWASDRIVFDD